MPIRPEFRHLYKTPEYRAARERVVQRAGNCCEECRKPNGERVETFTNYAMGFRLPGEGPRRGLPVMFWRNAGCCWRDSSGVLRPSMTAWLQKIRTIRVVLTLAHLDHNPANNDLDNVKLLCQWCHLNFDKLHHAETRRVRKDRHRPLLATNGAAS